MLIEIDISELKVGHFVVKIISQEGNCSLVASAHIKNEAVIKNLQNRKVYRVLIDDSKTLNQETTPPSLAPQTPITVNAKSLKKAKAIFNESKIIQRQLFESALSGSQLDLSPVIEITNKSIDAVFNSPDSLACMLNIRKKDEYLLEHSVAVSVYITLFARHLDLERSIIDQLSIGAFLHDIGKIKVPNEILNKPGKLTEEEFTIMKTHANHSIDIIKATPGISPLSLEVAALHHEKIDGTGYPFQVAGDDINQFGRMIAICDIFDALTATRVYKKGFTHNKAATILRELAKDGQLDPQLVDQFIKCVGVFPIGSLVQLKSNKLAIVKARNDHNPTMPQVDSFYSVAEKHFVDKEEIDLSHCSDTIVRTVRAEEYDLDMKEILEMLLMEG